MKVKSVSEVAQSCPTLSGPIDHSLPGSSIHGIFQARVLEWTPARCYQICWSLSPFHQYPLGTSMSGGHTICHCASAAFGHVRWAPSTLDPIESLKSLIFSVQHSFSLKSVSQGFPGSTVVKNPPANAGNMDLTPCPGQSHMPQSD